MYCSKCYRQIPDDSKFCPNCGTDVSIPTCIRCGNPIRHGDKFCNHCGVPISGYKEPPKKDVNWTFGGDNQNKYQEPISHIPKTQNNSSWGDRFQQERREEEKKASKIMIYIGAALIVFFLLFSGVADSAGDSKQSTLSEAEYIALCQTISYEELARDPSSKKGNYYTFEGEVIQVVENGNSVELRVNVTPVMFYDEVSYYEDTIYVTTQLKPNGKRILEGDIIRIYGKCTGLQSYLSIWGQKVSIPGINAAYWSVR